jgi:hypothetical protein
VRHRDRKVLVRHQHRARQLCIASAAARKRLDDRRKIGARIGEEIIDAMLGERAQKHLPGDRFALDAALHVRPNRSL